MLDFPHPFYDMIWGLLCSVFTRGDLSVFFCMKGLSFLLLGDGFCWIFFFFAKTCMACALLPELDEITALASGVLDIKGIMVDPAEP